VLRRILSDSKIASRVHRKGFKPLPEDGWHKDRDGPWEDYKKRCVQIGAEIDHYERIIWKNDDGLLHRDDGPSYESSDGSKKWHQRGKLHRDHGPAHILNDGSTHWYRHGLPHREHGPSVESSIGLKCWYILGLLHRHDGPAVVRGPGQEEYWFEGNQYSREEYYRLILEQHDSTFGSIGGVLSGTQREELGRILW